MICLVDATTFYCSCEKIFNPSVRNVPVVVLTNNDSNLAAVCKLAKQAGIPKFAPYFKVKSKLEEIGAAVFSSNYELYASVSSQMMETCARFAPKSDIYSIDEIFLSFPDNEFKHQDWDDMARVIRRTIWKEIRLPTSVGIGVNTTLAKAASHGAKRIEGYRGICVIDNEKSRQHVLSNMDVDSVWGIGSKIGKKLNGMGIHTAIDLANQNPAQMRKYFSILVENTVRELNGEVRLTFDEIRSPKKEIYSSRSFGQRVTELDQLRFALATHAEAVSAKLRKQNSLASGMTIFAHNSPYDAEPFFRKSVFISFAVPTQDTRIITAATEQALSTLYRAGVRYHKCGVGLMDLSSAENYQADLFTPSKDNVALMGCLDNINAKFGKGTARLAATGHVNKFSMRREFLSPQYTTNLNHIPRIKC